MREYLYGFLFCLVSIGIFMRGLFFDESFYVIEAVIFLVFLIYLFYLLYSKRMIPTIPALLFIIPITCTVFLIISDINRIGTLQEVLRYSAYACFFFMLYSVRKEKKIAQAMEISIIWLGLTISVLSLLVYCRWVPFNSWIVNNRIGGPLEYPNSYGALMGAFFIYTLYLVVNKAAQQKKVLLSISMFSFLVQLFLSGSLGGVGVTIFVLIVSLFFISSSKQMLALYYSVINCVAGLLVYSVRDFPIIMFALFLLLAFSMPYVLAKGSGYLVSKKNLFPIWLIPGTLFILVITSVMGLQLYKQPTAIERIQMSKDAFRIIVQHPLGSGGNSWEMLYSAYQSYPYIASKLHNGYLNFIVDWGIVGAAVGIVIIVFMIKLGYHNKIQFSLPSILFCTVILLHATIDFTLTYGSVWFLVCWQLCLAIQPFNNKETTKKRVLLAPIILFTCFTLLMSSKLAYAELLNKQWSSDLSVTEATALLERGIKANPYDPELQRRVGALYARVFVMTEKEDYKKKALHYLQSSENLQPFNSELKLQLAESYKLLQEKDKLLNLLIRGIELDPFQKAFYNQAFEVINQLDQTEKVNKLEQKITRQYEQAKEGWKNMYLPDRYNAKGFN